MKTSEIVFATSNKHKFAEAVRILHPYLIRPVLGGTKGLEIQSADPAEVALFAAKSMPLGKSGSFIIEDTGLFVRSLRGFPGSLAAYAFRTIGPEGVIRLLDGVRNRTARFESAVAYRSRAGVRVFRGSLGGKIALEPRGEEGFGFDAIFIPEGRTKTLGETSLEEKCTFSHRYGSMSSFATWYAHRFEPVRRP